MSELRNWVMKCDRRMAVIESLTAENKRLREVMEESTDNMVLVIDHLTDENKRLQSLWAGSADVIAHLQSEIERLREALERIQEFGTSARIVNPQMQGPMILEILICAEAALTERKKS